MNLVCCIYVLIIFVDSNNAYFPATHDTKEWWQTSVFYQIYPRSFQDSNGDGIGDLKGITSRLEHLKYSGIDATWLSPIFSSPMVDFGYDISNFREIHKDYGTMMDFQELIITAHKLDIKIILDFVPNHTSDAHEWFQKSIKRQEPYTNYYVWHDGIEIGGGQRTPPNNWLSVFRGSAWTWNEERGQYYLHQFAKEQPDLNFRNPLVGNEMKEILLFWLEKGVDGFRIDAVNHVFETEGYPDEPLSSRRSELDSYSYLDHIYTKDLLECYELVEDWRNILDEYANQKKLPPRVIMTEAYSNLSFTMKYYSEEDGSSLRAHIPFNFILITDLDKNSDSRDFVFGINKWLNYMPLGFTPNWVLGNHDKPRVGTRFGIDRVDGLNMLLMTLPGIAITYYGDEIGMTNFDEISWENTKDPWALNTNAQLYKKYSRDPSRTPFQWNFQEHSGFSTSPTTWLPVNPNYIQVNLKIQSEETKSHFKVYCQLTKLRKSRAFTHGSYRSLALNHDVFAFVREYGREKFVVILNLSRNRHRINLNVFETLSNQLKVVVTGVRSIYTKGDILETKNIELGPHESLILESIGAISYFEEIAITIHDKINLNNLIRLLIDGFTILASGGQMHKSDT